MRDSDGGASRRLLYWYDYIHNRGQTVTVCAVSGETICTSTVTDMDVDTAASWISPPCAPSLRMWLRTRANANLPLYCSAVAGAVVSPVCPPARSSAAVTVYFTCRRLPRGTPLLLPLPAAAPPPYPTLARTSYSCTSTSVRFPSSCKVRKPCWLPSSVAFASSKLWDQLWDHAGKIFVIISSLQGLGSEDWDQGNGIRGWMWMWVGVGWCGV